MNKYMITLALMLTVSFASAQTVRDKLQKAFAAFEQDPQLRYAISSLYVLDGKTGKPVFDKNSRVGLAPASTQKIIVSATAFELLGRDYRFKTVWSYEGSLSAGTLNGNLVITGYGDPTPGSDRYAATREKKLLDDWTGLLKQYRINRITGKVLTDNSYWESQTIPDGWVWEDIGNYYGAGISAINWRENQYDLTLQSGPHTGDAVKILKTEPALPGVSLISELRSGPKGSGDQAYIYLPPQASTGYIRGTIPPGENRFTISGALPDPPHTFVHILENKLKAAGIPIEGADLPVSRPEMSTLPLTPSANRVSGGKDSAFISGGLFVHYSPALDSISYWYLRKSINLYGEALVKAMAFEKEGRGRTVTGVRIIKDFWKEQGIDENELNIFDGSGLSPQNRVTTHAQATILQYARRQSWFTLYYSGFPVYNGIKMKSGTIKNVKGFCGYHTARDGKEYIFSFLVNNYHGNATALVQKMYTVLNALK